MTIKTHVASIGRENHGLYINGSYWVTVHGPDVTTRRARAEALAAGIREAWRTMPSAPLDGSTVDLWADGKRWPDYRWSVTGERWFKGLTECRNPTHWRKPEGPTT